MPRRHHPPSPKRRAAERLAKDWTGSPRESGAHEELADWQESQRWSPYSPGRRTGYRPRVSDGPAARRMGRLQSLISVAPFMLLTLCGLLNVAGDALARAGVPDTVSLAIVGCIVALVIGTVMMWRRRM